MILTCIAQNVSKCAKNIFFFREYYYLRDVDSILIMIGTHHSYQRLVVRKSLWCFYVQVKGL